MRLTYIASLSITLGFVLMPALSFSQEEPLVVSQPDPDSEIAPHVTSPVTDAAASFFRPGPGGMSSRLSSVGAKSL
jgi:hypothetical protein